MFDGGDCPRLVGEAAFLLQVLLAEEQIAYGRKVGSGEGGASVQAVVQLWETFPIKRAAR